MKFPAHSIIVDFIKVDHAFLVGQRGQGGFSGGSSTAVAMENYPIGDRGFLGP